MKLLEFLYTPDEAELASRLSMKREDAKDIALRLNRPAKEVIAGLLSMVRQGKVRMEKQDNGLLFSLAPLVVGSYEAAGGRMNAEMALLFENYYNDGGVYGIMQPQPALQRVLPAVDALDLEWILPYDNVLEILDHAVNFHVQDCICRNQQHSLGKGCEAPVHNCLSFSSVERAPVPGDISKEEAKALIAEAENAGLVHSVSNVVEGINYICNCCGCCCGILGGITKWGIENSMARANYEAVVDSDLCNGCGICRKRCQVSAITVDNGMASVDRHRCLGCGLCVTTCKRHAVKLLPRPESEQTKPPQDFGQWEHDRLKSRGLL